MTTLDIEFNCLCLFVTDEPAKTVHVLMPAMNGHDGHADHDKHVVRMLHRSFKGDEKLFGRPMEGLALELGPDPANARTQLTPPPGAPVGGALPHLGEAVQRATGAPGPATVSPQFVGPNPGGRVAARVTLRAGEVIRLASEAEWVIEGVSVALAHRVTWRVPGLDPSANLSWTGLNGNPNTAPPLRRLDELEPEDDLSYTLRIFNVTANAFPLSFGKLAPEVMRQHFRAFYPLLGVDDPDDSLLPQITGVHINQVNCGGGQVP